MYYLIVATLMFLFPVLSIGVEAAGTPGPLVAALLVKWFVFWSVGWRLLLAGMRQIAQRVRAPDVAQTVEALDNQVMAMPHGPYWGLAGQGRLSGSLRHIALASIPS